MKILQNLKESYKSLLKWFFLAIICLTILYYVISARSVVFGLCKNVCTYCNDNIATPLRNFFRIIWCYTVGNVFRKNADYKEKRRFDLNVEHAMTLTSHLEDNKIQMNDILAYDSEKAIEQPAPAYHP